MSEVRQSKKGKNKPAKPNETEQTLRDDKESKQTEGSSEGMEMEPWVDKGKQEWKGRAEPIGEVEGMEPNDVPGEQQKLERHDQLITQTKKEAQQSNGRDRTELPAPTQTRWLRRNHHERRHHFLIPPSLVIIYLPENSTTQHKPSSRVEILLSSCTNLVTSM